MSFFGVKGVTAVPVAVSVFPDELYPALRSWAERAYHKRAAGRAVGQRAAGGRTIGGYK